MGVVYARGPGLSDTRKGQCSSCCSCLAIRGSGRVPASHSLPRPQDLEQYAASYSGLMRIERLQFIADHCPPLRVEALKMALSFVQRTFNVDVYEEIHRKLSEATR